MVTIVLVMSATNLTYPVNGYVLRELRMRAGFSQGRLAREAHVSRPYITRLEAGLRQHVSPRVFTGLLEALAVTDRRVLLAQADDSPAGAA